MRTLLFIYLYIYKNDKDFAKAGGNEKRGEGAIIPFSFFLCVSIYCVRKRVLGTNMCTSTQPHGAVYTVG